METKTLLETFRYPRLGPGMMWDAARDFVVAKGNQVLMGHSFKQLAQDGDGNWRMTATKADGGEAVIRARHVISSAPMRELAARIHPLPACSLQADNLRYRDFLTVAVMIKSDDLFPDNWIYIHDSKVKVGRIQNFRSWSPEMVPDPSVACVGLEYFCFEGDGLWSSSDADLVELAKKELAILGLVDPKDVIGGAVVRQEKAYPVYDDAYAANVEAMRHELESRYPTLHMVGRNGMHRYNNQDHAMMTAMLTVENIEANARIYNIWNVNEDAEYHEAGDEGEQEAIAAAAKVALTEDQAVALASERDVPARIAPERPRKVA
jgi:protoporphyrinogen oxidase